MKEIWKFDIKPGRFTVDLPKYSLFRSVQVQRGEAKMWIEVDRSLPNMTIEFMVVPTGLPFDESGKRYLGTFLVENDSLVFHLYCDESPIASVGGGSHG